MVSMGHRVRLNGAIFLSYVMRCEVPRVCQTDVKGENFTLPIGQCKIERVGTDVTLVSYSRGVHTCLEAAAELEASGVSCEVIFKLPAFVCTKAHA